MNQLQSDLTDASPASREQDLLRQIEQMRAELLDAQKMGSIGMLTSSITHEFNNILMTVINYAKIGLRQKDDASREKAFQKILAAGERAKGITTGMLALARGDKGPREATSLARLVSEVLVLCEKELSKHHTDVRILLDDDPQAVVSASQIQQVLLNLIVNARQAMGERGTLLLQTKTNREAGTAEILVRDTGPGIPAEKLRTIFERFYSTKTRDEEGRGGTGLGLALCKDIVEAHEGRIRVESAVGKGTAFTLVFPLADVASVVTVTR